jgi:hypothetical protein
VWDEMALWYTKIIPHLNEKRKIALVICVDEKAHMAQVIEKLKTRIFEAPTLEKLEDEITRYAKNMQEKGKPESKIAQQLSEEGKDILLKHAGKIKSNIEMLNMGIDPDMLDE